MVRQFDASRMRPRCVAFDSSGAYACVGFTSGVVKLIDPQTFEDVATFKNFKDAILHVK